MYKLCNFKKPKNALESSVVYQGSSLDELMLKGHQLIPDGGRLDNPTAGDCLTIYVVVNDTDLPNSHLIIC